MDPRAPCLRSPAPAGPSLSISPVLVTAPEDPRVADGPGDQHQGPASGPGVGGQAGGGDAGQELVPEAGDLPPQVRAAPSPYVRHLPGGSAAWRVPGGQGKPCYLGGPRCSTGPRRSPELRDNRLPPSEVPAQLAPFHEDAKKSGSRSLSSPQPESCSGESF